MTSRIVQIGLGLLAATTVACSATETTSKSSDGGSAHAGGNGVGGAGGDTTSAGGSFTVGAGGAGGSEGCLEEEATATVSPLDIIVLLDRSGSMEGALWDGAVNALTSFFQNPGGNDISAGINYFPAPNGAECQRSSYNPLHVPIVSLATDAATLVSDMQGQTPSGAYTPTHGGMYGTLQFANTYQDQNPTHVVITVLASDGDPTSCNTNITDIAALAQTVYDYNGVRTFVIAIQGATLANLDQIAAAGGTVAAYDVTTDVTLFAQKLDEIRKEVLACEFIIPDPTSGDFDPTKVNVSYTPGNGDPTQDLPQASDLADCGNMPGWYYDNATAPTKITLCPATCAVVQADDMAKVDFVFGCPTILN